MALQEFLDMALRIIRNTEIENKEVEKRWVKN
jgi:hypothetical protein